MKKQHKIQSTCNYGDMALCNLASINVVEYLKKSNEGRMQICRSVIRALDSSITYGVCPIPEGTLSNELYRYCGVGIMNCAQALALEGIVIDTPAACEWFDALMDDISYNLYYQSMLLAKELGPFPEFSNTKWAEGITPVHESLRVFPDAWDITEYSKSKFDLKRWDHLGSQIKRYGIRNAQVIAIAPTANSGKAINATESTEPVHGLIYKDEGIANVTSLAPNIKTCMQFYKNAFDCNQEALVKNAIVRQKYIDQSQSVTLYFKDVSSLKELTRVHNLGFKHGVKTYYYLKQAKNTQDLDECVACAV